MSSDKICGRIELHINLIYLLDSNELKFLTYLKYLDYLRGCGCRTAYSREFTFRGFQLSRAVFYGCAKRMERLNLLERKTVGKFTDYCLVTRSYERLVVIASATSNINALCSFSKSEFKLNGRGVDQITDSEIRELRELGKEIILI